MAGQRLVYRVVDDFVDEVMETRRAGRPDVHRRPLAHGLEALEDLDLVRAVIVRAPHRCRCRRRWSGLGQRRVVWVASNSVGR